MIRVLLLGPPAVFQDDQPLRIQRRIQRVLLIYLACHLEPVSRAELALMFWPDDSERDSRRHLREAISKLRAALPDPSIWVGDNERIGLDHRRIDVDVISYNRLLQRTWRNVTQAPLHLPLPEAVYKEILAALGMWRAPRFLSGAELPSSSELERWLLNLAQDMEYSHQRLQERIAHHYAAIGDLEQAAYWLRQALLGDELNESLHAQVVEWLHRLGRRGEMLAYIQSLRELYHREAGGLPEPLNSLCRDLARPTPAGVPGRPPWQPVRGLQIPFVGRAGLLRALRLAFQSGGCLVLTGEAGAGKTRLIQQFYHTIDPSPRLLYARAHPGERGLPFQPLSDMLRQGVTREEWLRLGPAWGAHLVPLLPELVDLWPDLPPSGVVRMQAARGQLFEALLQVIRLVTGDRPTLFFLDDAHWSDEATLAALAYLDEREVFARRGLLVLAARGEELGRALQDFMARSVRPGWSVLDIGLLTVEEVAELARYALGQTPAGELVEQLAGGTGGNPLFLLETLRSWLDVAANPVPILGAHAPPVAASMRALLRERTRGFSARKRAVLTTAAVIGREFTPAVLEAACDLAPEALVIALEDLERDHLITPTAGSQLPEGYVFIHEQLRELLVLDLSPARRRMLHMRVAAALESVFGARTPQQAAALAAHRQAAGQDLEAYHLWLRTAAYARQLFSPGEAGDAYRRAAQLVTRILARLSDANISALYGDWGELAYELNDPATQEQAYKAMLAIGEERGSARLVGSALSGLASASGLRGQCEQALHAVTQAIPYLEESGDVYECILARIRRGRFLMNLNRYADALQAFRDAAAFEPRATEPRARRVIVRAYAYLSLAYGLTGWPRLALETSQHARDESQLLLYPASQARTHTALAVSSYFLGRYTAALEHCRAGFDLGEAAAGRWQTGMLRAVFARCLLGLGRLDEAWQHSQTALEYGRSMALAQVCGEALCVQGDLFYLLGDPQRAVECYRDGLAAEAGQSFTTLELDHRLGAALARTGQVQAGRERVLPDLLFAQQAGLGAIQTMTEVALAEIEIQAGNLAAAEDRLQTAHRLADERGMAVITPICNQLSARLHRLRGCAVEAQRLAVLAADQAAALQNPLLVLLACQELAGALRLQRQSSETARQRAQEALEQLDRQTHLPAIRPAFERFRSILLERMA